MQNYCITNIHDLLICVHSNYESSNPELCFVIILLNEKKNNLNIDWFNIKKNKQSVLIQPWIMEISNHCSFWFLNFGSVYIIKTYKFNVWIENLNNRDPGLCKIKSFKSEILSKLWIFWMNIQIGTRKLVLLSTCDMHHNDLSWATSLANCRYWKPIKTQTF